MIKLLILYYVLCIIITFGMILEDYSQNIKYKFYHILVIYVFSFILIPIFLGILISQHLKR